MKSKLLFTVLLFTGLLAYANPPEEEGKKIFISRCASCHTVNKLMTGPALAGIEDRHSFEWIANFVRSSQAMIKNGDKEAVTIYEAFNRVPMPDHPDITDEHVKDLLAYIKEQTSTATSEAPFAAPKKLQTPYQPLSLQKDYGVFIGFLGVVGILILILLFAVHSAGFQRKLRERNISLPE